MGYPKNLLSEDENVVLETHPHWKMLVLPILEMLVVLAVVGFFVGVVDDDIVQYISFGTGFILLVVFVLIPFLRWRTTLFVITDKRVVMRTGILSRTGRDIPLSRVNDVTFQHNLLERILGCGTLVVESAGERGQVELNDIPHVQKVQHTLYELVENAGPL